MRPRIAILTAVLVAAVSLAHGDVPQVPALKSYVTDLTGTLSPAEVNLLSERLKTFEDSTSNQVVVAIVPTTGETPLEDYSLQVAQGSKVGQKGRNNGVVLLVAKDDRHIRIEVGYGLEGALPDALCGQIIRHEIGPRFQQGDYFGGISSGVDAIILATKGEYTGEEHGKGNSPLSGVIVPFVFIIFFIFFVIRNAFRPWRRRLGGFGPTMWGGSSFGGGGWSGGSSGGGFSGGGGSFGGGGASGGW
jgi:uncharacterized protein